jgi:hypothetical protein
VAQGEPPRRADAGALQALAADLNPANANEVTASGGERECLRIGTVQDGVFDRRTTLFVLVELDMRMEHC